MGKRKPPKYPRVKLPEDTGSRLSGYETRKLMEAQWERPNLQSATRKAKWDSPRTKKDPDDGQKDTDGS